MAVIAPPTPSDQRLDDLSRRVDEGFRKVDEGFRKVDEAIRDNREELRQFRTEVSARLNTADTRIHSTQQMIIKVGAGLFGTMLIGFLSVIATVLTTHP